MQKLCVYLAVVLMLLTGTAFAAPAGEAVGILDINKLMAESPKVKALQVQLDEKYVELRKQLETEKPNLTPEQFKQKQDEAFKTLLQTKLNFDAQIDESIRQAAAEVAKEKGLSLVVIQNSVTYGGTDITQDVLNKMR
ncbi:MAG TPA: molecular chaperone Skp [Firmicutes bacterium]|nr:molecular chaperone Skp [Bacillota bacterium]